MLPLVLLAMLAACGHADHAPIDQPTPVVTLRATSEWLIEVTRTQETRSAKAAIVVSIAPTEASPAPHLAVASAQAWLALARAAMDLNAATDAVAAARAGIADLGDDYRPKRVKDDTGLHILDANGAIAAGRMEEGARTLISVLDVRIGLYFRRYENEARPSR